MNKYTGHSKSVSRSVQVSGTFEICLAKFSTLYFSSCLISDLLHIFNFSKYIYATAVLFLVLSAPLNLVSSADFINLLFAACGKSLMKTLNKKKATSFPMYCRRITNHLANAAKNIKKCLPTYIEPVLKILSKTYFIQFLPSFLQIFKF